MKKYVLPQQKITVTHGGVGYSLETDTINFDATLRENAVDSLQMVASDYKSATFLEKADVGDNIQLEFRFKDETDIYTQLFGGWIENLKPTISEEGEVLALTSLGYASALRNMLVRQQYGSQSGNSTLNTIQEVLTDDTHGIIPKYVNYVLASDAASGYTINTTKVPDLTSDFRYLYFPGKPALKCLEDMIDLISAANVPNAGVHWIVNADGTTPYLCLATIGDHENPPADVWSTWWNGDVAGSTIEVSKEMLSPGFNKQRSEANYVLFVGNFRRPANGDKWTEGNALTEWGTHDATVANEGGAGLFKIGSYSIREAITEVTGAIYYPKTPNLNFDITAIGTKHIIPRIGFYLRRNADCNPSVTIEMGTGAFADANTYYMAFSELPNADEWKHLTFPIGPYYDMDETTEVEWRIRNSPDWRYIDYVSFWTIADDPTPYLYIDGLYIDGLISRAAYDSSKYASQRCKMLFIRDDVPKDDSLVAGDDSGQMAQFAKAELYRAVTEPILGQITIPMQPTIKAGQLAHIHFGEKKDGSFRIDMDMRIINVRHHLSRLGALTYLDLTDDLKNSHPIQPTNAYNAVMKAVAPGFQDRARSSIIASDIDLDQPILEKEYST